MPRKLRNFFKTPKGILTLIFAVFLTVAAPIEGRASAIGWSVATLAAGLVDAVLLRAKKKVWEFPSGAVLTALIVAMVLRSQEPWYVVTLTAVTGVVSKYIFRFRSANVFNPAALAMVATFGIFHTGQSWWGALTEAGPAGLMLLLAAGIFVAQRVNKIPLVLAFLGTYFLLFTVTAFVGDARWVAEIYRSPDLEAALYFAFIILTDPPTSPAKHPDQIACGVIVAVVSFAFFEWAGVVYYLLAGVLVGNLWEAWRRYSRRSGVSFPAGIGAFLTEITPLGGRP